MGSSIKNVRSKYNSDFVAYLEVSNGSLIYLSDVIRQTEQKTFAALIDR